MASSTTGLFPHVHDVVRPLTDGYRGDQFFPDEQKEGGGCLETLGISGGGDLLLRARRVFSVDRGSAGQPAIGGLAGGANLEIQNAACPVDSERSGIHARGSVEGERTSSGRAAGPIGQSLPVPLLSNRAESVSGRSR